MNEPAIRCIHDTHATVGESPVWDAAARALWWVDIAAPAVYRLDFESGNVRRWTMPRAVSAVALTASPDRVAVALADGVHWFNPESEALTLLVDPEPERPDNRLNDGKVGPDGAFWIGSMDDRPAKEPVAALHRVTADGTTRRMVEGLTISNGLAWSADGRTMYHTDTRGPWIDRWDFDPATGAIANRTRVATLANADGRPDGGATDMSGIYWSCGVSASCLNAFDRNGTLVRKIALPFPRPTMVAFGGPELKTMFVTCGRENLSEAVLAATPLAGGVFAMPVDVPGVPVGLFGGS